MTDQEVIDRAVQIMGVERYRWLCSEANTHPTPNSREDWLRFVREIAEAPTSAYPPAMEQAGNLSRALWDWTVSGFSMASEVERNRRLEICTGCEFFAAGRCRKCGCFTQPKAAIKTSHCPIGKW